MVDLMYTTVSVLHMSDYTRVQKYVDGFLIELRKVKNRIRGQEIELRAYVKVEVFLRRVAFL